MAVNVADLTATLRLDSSKFTQGAQQATTQTDQLSKSLSTMPGPAGQAASALGRIGTFLSGPLGLVAGAAAATAGLTALVKSVSNSADDIQKMSIRTGASVETLSSLRLAAELANSSVEDVDKAFKFLARSVEGASQGTGNYVDALRQLNVDLGQLQSQRPEEQFETMARAIVALPDPTQRAAAALDIFGRAGTQLLPLLDDISHRGLAGVREESDKLGTTISRNTAIQAEVLNDTLKRLSAVGRGLALSLGSEVLPLFTSAAEVLLKAGQATAAFLREFQVIPIVAKAVQITLFPIIEGFQTMGAAVAAAAFVLQGQFGEALQVVEERAKNFGANLADLIKKPALTGADAAARALRNVAAASEEDIAQQRAATITQSALLRELQTTTQQAAHERAVAERTAAGDILGSLQEELAGTIAAIDREKEVQLQKIQDVSITGQRASEARALVEQQAQDRIVAATLAGTEKQKAALRGLVSEAADLLGRLGKGFEDTLARINLVKTAQQSLVDLRTVENLARLPLEQGGLTGRETFDIIRRLREQFQAQQSQARTPGGVAFPELTPGLRALTADAQAASEQVFILGNSFSQTASAADAVRQQIESLNLQLAGQSLDDDARSAAAGVGELSSQLEQSAAIANTAHGSFEEVVAISRDITRLKFANPDPFGALVFLNDMERITTAVAQAGSQLGQTFDAFRGFGGPLFAQLRDQASAIGLAPVTELTQRLQDLQRVQAAQESFGTGRASVGALEGELARLGPTTTAAAGAAAGLQGRVVDATTAIARHAGVVAAAAGSLNTLQGSFHGAAAGAGQLATILDFVNSLTVEAPTFNALTDVRLQRLQQTLTILGPSRVPSFQTEPGEVRVVPGPIGAPIPAIVHGGERITSAGKGSGAVAIHINLNGMTVVDTDRRMNQLAEAFEKRIRRLKVRGVL